MDLDRQAIERKDFPIGRRGYDPDAVDAHLRTLAGEFEEIRRVAVTGSPDASLAATAGTHVQSIIEAAETAAAEIERHALESARQVREAADQAAERTREQAVEKARAHVAVVAQVSSTLLERVNAMDGEVQALVQSLRAGAGRLAADLSAVESGMSDLYDSAAGRAETAQPAPPPRPPAQPAPAAFESQLETAIASEPPPPPAAPVAAAQPAAAEAEAGSSDIDGARLIALNMALNGESRADTERYLAENFQIPDRLKLIDEVYAAIEG